MKKSHIILLSVCFTFLLPGLVHAYELPKVIGYLSPENLSISYGYDFCAIGDVNGDGCSELLVMNEQSNQVELFYGGDTIGPWFDALLLPESPIMLFKNMRNIGYLIPDEPEYFNLRSVIRIDSLHPEVILLNQLFQGGHRIDNEPEFVFEGTHSQNGLYTGRDGFNTRPVDVNGDGYDDFIAFLESDPPAFRIYFGGADFDTIPDWEVSVDIVPNYTSVINISAGYDINNDGYEDILIRTWERYLLYLGGSPMDTVPVFSIPFDQFEGRYENREMDQGFSQLPDVNGDGYDDWAICWQEAPENGNDDDGVFLFFGSENPDAEPDVNLEGHRRLWMGSASVAGGDFNNDGFGDIVTSFANNVATVGEIQIHLGSRWIDEEADICIDTEHDYHRWYFNAGARVGAVADYNGDETDDFVVWRNNSDFPHALVIFAGNSEWEVGVEDNTIPELHSLDMQAIPNPFNSRLTISFSLQKASETQLSVYDVRGRMIHETGTLNLSAGEHKLGWGSSTAGIYFVVLKADGVVEARKVVCLQ